MTAFYTVLILIIGVFTYAGLYYVRKELDHPDHVSPQEQAIKDALGDQSAGSGKRVFIVPDNVSVVYQQKTVSEPEPKPPAEESARQDQPPVQPSSAQPEPLQDFYYTLHDKIVIAPKYIDTKKKDFNNRPIITTIPGSVRLIFKGAATGKIYPPMEIDPGMVDHAQVGQTYSRQQINILKMH